MEHTELTCTFLKKSYQWTWAWHDNDNVDKRSWNLGVTENVHQEGVIYLTDSEDKEIADTRRCFITEVVVYKEQIRQEIWSYVLFYAYSRYDGPVKLILFI